MRFVLPLMCCLSAACETRPAFEVDDSLLCPEIDADTEGGLLQHLTRADALGAFFYDPPQPLVRNVDGAYDLTSGDLSWVSTYADGYYLTKQRVVGQGVAYTDGDLDLAYSVQEVREDGDLDTVSVREVRLGCDVERDVFNQADKLIRSERGTYRPKGYVYTTERIRRGVVVPIDGVRQPDGRWTEEEAYRVDDYEYVGTAEADGLGRIDTSFREVEGNELREGTIRRLPDGSERHRFTVTLFNATAEWDYTLNFRGTGKGTAEVTPNGIEPYTCEVSFKKGTCSIDCPNYPEEPC